jgi:acyl carrier protein
MASQPVSDLNQDVLRLLGYILGRKIEAHENPSRTAEPNWDSLKHIELMFLLEDELGVRLSETAMVDMQDAEGIVRELTRSGAITCTHAP